MLVSCKQFICADADISAISKYLLDVLKLDYRFLINQYKNYQDVKVHVIYDENEFFEIMKTKGKFLFCSDSKTDAELNGLKLQADDKDIVIITSDSAEEHIKLDDYLKVLFSPKIIYGLDSTMRRDIFCHYKGHTISPSQMVQQLCRCRDIDEVYIFFSNVTSKSPTYETIEETHKHYNTLVEDYSTSLNALHLLDENESGAIKYHDQTITDIMVIKIFNEMYKMNAYKQDCYEKNKFLRFINILKAKKFDVIGEYQKIQKVITLNSRRN
jgi:hypothetical protein